ncbi:benenodin family lasso peptide [Sphingomonas oryzagri]
MNKVADFEVEDLGVASVETKGQLVSGAEQFGTHQPIGISDND